MNDGLRPLLKAAAFWTAVLGVSPLLLSFRVRSLLLGADRALHGSTQLLSLVPGVTGQYLRRAFLFFVLDFHPSATVEFGTTFSKAGSRIEENVYIGPGCHLGLVHVERETLLGAGVHVPSGPRTHGTADPFTPIREQPGEVSRIRIGAGAWIGSTAVVMADVGSDSIVAAGAVVTDPVPDRVLAAGVPARVVRERSS